jgi:hypothetical protein
VLIGNLISMNQATALQNGFLTYTDFQTFNNKQNALTLTTTGTSGAATLVGATLNIPNYAPDLSGYVTLATTQTISGAKTFSAALNGTSAIFTEEVSARNGNISIGLDATYSIPYMALGWGGRTNANNKIYAARDATDGIIINAATGRGVVINTNGGATSAVNITSSGNLGLGVTPSAWQTANRQVFQFGKTGYAGFIGYNTSSGSTTVGSNCYSTGSSESVWTYLDGSAPSLYQAGGGVGHIWYNAPSGTAGNAITFTQAMTLTAAGRLLIGTPTEASYMLDVNGTGRFSGVLSLSAAESNTVYLGAFMWTPGTYTGFRQGTDQSFNIDTYNGGTYLNPLKITQAGAATFSSSVTAGGLVSISKGSTTPTDPSLSATNGYLILGDASGYNASALEFGVYRSSPYSSYIQSKHWNNDGATYPLAINPLGGNVLIGTTTDDTVNKLQVTGDIKVSAKLKVGSSQVSTNSTTTAITTAKTIYTRVGNGKSEFVFVMGDVGGTAYFADIVSFASGASVVVISSTTTYGLPSARTYSVSGNNLQLSMASGTAETQVFPISGS